MIVIVIKPAAEIQRWSVAITATAAAPAAKSSNITAAATTATRRVLEPGPGGIAPPSKCQRYHRRYRQT
jgi:hypothetical protein